MKYTYIESAIGPLLVKRDNAGITGLYTSNGKHTEQLISADWQRDDAAFGDVQQQLSEYFAGTRRAFDLPLNVRGNRFQNQVWAALREIPYGVTTSYGKLAVSIGHPGGARAVGVANAQNPVSIIVPCHRVIGANGDLVGYGGGLDNKRFLLDHEAQTAGVMLPLFG